MNSVPRVLLVTRRFWPLAGDNAWRLLALATEMRNAGWHVEVVTALWHSAWPKRVQLREFDVQRIGPSPITPFRTRRYTRAVWEWIADAHQAAGRQGHPIDLVLIDSTEDETPALLARANQLPKVVLRFDTLEGIGPLSDRLRQRTFSACKQASKVIVPHEHARRELIAAGVTPQRIDLIPDGPFPKFQRDGQTRASARRALADINYDLHLRSDDRLCVCFTDPIKNVEVELVVRTLAPILEARRGMRLWLVGDLPERRRFHELISRRGWKQEVLLVGNFEDPDTVLMASDLCIVPSSTQGLACIMPTAIQSGLPTLACDCPAVRSRFGEHCQPLCFEPGNAEQLHQRVVQWCDQPNVFQEPVARVSQLLMQNTAGAQMYL